MFSDALQSLQALREKGTSAPIGSGLVLVPASIQPPGDGSVDPADIDLLFRYCPALVIHREGTADAKTPFPNGRSDYHPRSVEFYLDQAHLLASSRGRLLTNYGGIFGLALLRARDAIVHLVRIMSLVPLPAILAIVLAWLVVTLLFGLVIVIAARWLAPELQTAVSLVFLFFALLNLGLGLWPFYAEQRRRWPRGVAEIRAALEASSQGLPQAVITPVDVVDERGFWESYKKRDKAGPRVVYARLATNRDGWLVAEYWLFYAFNNWLNNHDADWEFVALFIPDRDAKPRYMFCSSHEGGTWRPWHDAHPFGAATDRRAVYVARGSHAMYFEPVPGGHRPTGLFSLSGVPLFGRNLAVRFIADRRNQRDWVPSISPETLPDAEAAALEIRVMPRRVGRALRASPEVWDRWWWLRFRGSWSRSTTIEGPRWQERGAKWQALAAFVRRNAVGDLGPFQLD